MNFRHVQCKFLSLGKKSSKKNPVYKVSESLEQVTAKYFKEEEISVLKDTLLSRQMQVATAQAALATAESSLEEELRKHDAAISAAKHQRDEALSSANGEISGLQERVASLTSEVSSLSSKHGEI